MSQQFKIIERGQPGVAGGGKKMYYAGAVADGELKLDGISTSIEKRCTVNGADILAVLHSLAGWTGWAEVQDGEASFHGRARRPLRRGLYRQQ